MVMADNVKSFERHLRVSLALFLVVLLVGSSSSGANAEQATSRVYVSAYPCTIVRNGKTVNSTGTPSVALYDQNHYGETNYSGFTPTVVVDKTSTGESEFHFDVLPGNYSAFIKFSNVPLLFFRDGPLIVLPERERHLLVGGCGLVDWHSVGAIAGRLPPANVRVSVLLFDRPVQCGDDYHALDQKTLKALFPRQRSEAVMDDGAYYANFHGYGRQEQTLALVFSGALFTEGAILLTNTPNAATGKPPFIIKNLTPEIIQTAFRAEGKLACLPGF
jgi:hypothetical protein